MAISALLLDTKDLVSHARDIGADGLGADALANLADCYETIVAMGHEQHPPVAGKKTKAHNLLLRLARDQTDVLRFAHDFRVPFANNQAEQDIRMVKLQQKLSGCWRTPDGADRSWRSAATSLPPARTTSVRCTRWGSWSPGRPGCQPQRRPDPIGPPRRRSSADG